ncbi:MAG: Succinate--CoA ligase [ADP-forming] subunit beta [Candidatus Omnitrophica bacterium]|nr:Succinate--CoA ligase [ADP-forming] subunit beta [Candidatus Omnitrophota bacterium]
MKTHEYQARDLFAAYGIPTSKGALARTPEEARSAFASIGQAHCMWKVQVQMGGRGKAGGVRRISSADEAARLTAEYIGKTFSTYQSPEGKTVRAVLLTEDKPILAEYYLGATIDRSSGLPVLLFSKQGGVDIEEVAAKDPEAILKHRFSPGALPAAADLRSLVGRQISDASQAAQIADIATRLARLFVEKDAALVEVNPLALSEGNTILALDAKIVFDDNALFRHADIAALKDPEEDDERERKAKAFGLSYVSMNGNIGCLVNGAGLAMATMDMIKLAGGEPANFLDVGGGATADQVREGFKIILQDDRVQAILVNIFGGIMKCDVIAEGVIQASREISLSVPLIVRLEGTRVQEGRKLLEQSGLRIASCKSIQEAAQTAVRQAREHADVHSR